MRRANNQKKTGTFTFCSMRNALLGTIFAHERYVFALGTRLNVAQVGCLEACLWKHSTTLIKRKKVRDIKDLKEHSTQRAKSCLSFCEARTCNKPSKRPKHMVLLPAPLWSPQMKSSCGPWQGKKVWRWVRVMKSNCSR